MNSLTKEMIELLLTFDEAEEYRPIVARVFKLLKSYGPGISDLLDGIFDYSIKRRIRSVNILESNGFSRDDAINLVMDEWYAMARNARQQSHKQS